MKYIWIRQRDGGYVLTILEHVANGQPVSQIWNPTILTAEEIGQIMGGN